MKLKILACLIGILLLAPFVLGQEDSGVDWEVFKNGSADQVRAEIAKLPKDSGLEAWDEEGWTPLMHAASFNSNPDVITVLLKAGADVKVKSRLGETALDYAKENEEIYKTKAYWELNDANYKED